MKPDVLDELDVLLRTRYGVVVIETDEAQRAETLLRHAAARRGLPLFTWSPLHGLRREGKDAPVYGTDNARGALQHVAASGLAALYHFQDAAPVLDDAASAASLREAAEVMGKGEGAIVLTGVDIAVPDALRGTTATLRLPSPDASDYRTLLLHVLRDLAQRMKVEVSLDEQQKARLLNGLRGLTLMEAEKLLTRAVVEDGRLDADDLKTVLDAKKQVIEQQGLLEYYPPEWTLADVADMRGLKEWLSRRRALLTDPERARRMGLDFPRGILLLGVPGCGKSLCAKAVAMDWGLPLLKLDPSNLYNRYVGESERNFRRATSTAERLSPVVLWIDEIEKAFAADASGGDGGLSTRILGTFLSWLQEREGDVFVVATANDISRLPPELLRKGRFDEIFFVDLPDAETRRAILEVHLRRRGQDAAAIDLDAVAAATDGFSGAEIEQVVVSGLYDALADATGLSTAMLVREARKTAPLSRTMAEKVLAVRQWARGRAVGAN